MLTLSESWGESDITIDYATFSEQGASPTFTLAGEINRQATDQLFKEGLLSDEESELFEQDSTPIAGHSISSETIHPMADTAEFTFDLGLEAANTSLEFSSEVTNHSWDFQNNQTTNHLGALIPSQEIQEDPLALSQNHQFSDLIAFRYQTQANAQQLLHHQQDH